MCRERMEVFLNLLARRYSVLVAGRSLLVLSCCRKGMRGQLRVRRKRVLIPNREIGHVDHLVYAKLTTPHGVVPRVLCEVFLPKFKSKEPCFKFYPTEKQSDFLRHIWAFDLTATIR